MSLGNRSRSTSSTSSLAAGASISSRRSTKRPGTASSASMRTIPSSRPLTSSRRSAVDFPWPSSGFRLIMAPNSVLTSRGTCGISASRTDRSRAAASPRPRSLGANEGRALVWEGDASMSAHRLSLLRRLGPALAVLTGLSVLGLTVPGVAQRFEYVISFDNVVVEGTGTFPDTPELAHREVIGLDAVVAQGHAAVAGGVPPTLTVRSPGSLLPFEPGLGTENASFRQEGFLVESLDRK